MAQANRVHSTPRRTASKNKPETSESDRHHAEAFRDLELPILSLFYMGEIAAEVTNGLQTDDRLEMTHFAIFRLCDMIVDLHANYSAALNAGKAVA
jgi:hypothetical protein